ncbi:late control protein D [Leptospira phage LE3]|uniref:Late control protein D n=1 Tax=Leptospira phage LE3 TaxID=2041382 RepID=A0A343LE44_9CAUD|nr:late control protein D [Leptospira phage LE3]ATN94954.1 late control protein D [Leptospira phage LE3]
MITVQNESLIQPYYKVKILKGSGTSLSGEEINGSDNLQFNIQEISITEKEREAGIVELTVKDSTGVYDRMLVNGVLLDIEWGLLDTKDYWNPIGSSEISGSRKRRIKCAIINRSQRIGEGASIYTFTARTGVPSSGLPRIETYKSGSVQSLIKKVGNRIGAVETMVDFEGMNTVLTSKNAVTQDNINDFRFMFILSEKYGFNLSYQTDEKNLSKILRIYCLSLSKSQNLDLNTFRGIKGQTHYFNYGDLNNSNIISADLDANVSQVGSNAELTTGPDGKPQLVVRPAKTESVDVYELNMDAINREMKSLPPGDRIKRVLEVLNSGSEEFMADLLPKYFRKSKTTTAFEGNGYTAKMEIVPNPDIQIGDKAFLGNGGSRDAKSVIAPRFKSVQKGGVIQKNTLYRVVEVSQKIGSSGYTMSLTVAR